jgi:hypothetical protein
MPGMQRTSPPPPSSAPAAAADMPILAQYFCPAIVASVHTSPPVYAILCTTISLRLRRGSPPPAAVDCSVDAGCFNRCSALIKFQRSCSRFIRALYQVDHNSFYARAPAPHVPAVGWSCPAQKSFKANRSCDASSSTLSSMR